MTQPRAIAGPAWILTPADQPETFEPISAAADVMVVDLWRGVAQPHRDFARQCLREYPLDPATTLVRVNPVGTPEHDADLAALAETNYTTLVVPVIESAAELEGLDDYQLVASIGSACAALALPQIAASGVLGLWWVADDLVADLGGLTSRKCNGMLRDIALHVRSQTLLHAHAHGLFAVDGVFTDTTDGEGLLGETLDASSSGFAAKAGVLAEQAAVLREGFLPKPDKLERARRVVERAQDERGRFTVDGHVVDAAALELSRRMVTRADAAVAVSR